MVIIQQATTIAELEGILALQQANLPTNISTTEALEQGFVTVVHDLPLLYRMNEASRHTIAKDADLVVGYCLTMLPDFRTAIPILSPMFDLIDTLSWEGKALKETPYVVMGQTCIAKSHRGRGIFDQLYAGLKQFQKKKFKVVITEVSTRNQRSWRAHQRVGFQLIHQYKAPDGEEWLLIGMNLD
jgi:hypothetical protein